MSRTTLDGVPADLSLLVAKDGSGRRQIIETVITVGAGDCGFVRDRMLQAYGPTQATRQSSSQAMVAGTVMTFADDSVQWRAGATMITEGCGMIAAGARTIYTISVDLEPATTAMLLAPPIAMNCPDLNVGAPATGALIAPTLTLDPRGEIVRGPDRKVIAALRISDARFAFDLTPERTIEINRRTGAYLDRTTPSPAAQTPQGRHGMCQTIDASH